MTALERAVGVERCAPPELVRQLRVIDPTGELVYMGYGRWMLGRIISSAPIRGAGERLLESCARVLEQRWKRIPWAADHSRYRFGQLRLRGFQATTEYVIQGEPTAAIVRDQEVMQFMYSHISEQELDQLADAPFLERQANAIAETKSEARARDAWRYLFTRSHSVTRHDGKEQRARSGFTIQRRLSA